MRHTALSLHRNVSFPRSMTDVRGYEVRTRDNNEKVGKVSDLVCADDGHVRYLDVGLGGLFNKKRVLLPVGVARVDKSNDVVWIAGMSKDQVKELPEYDGDPARITEDYEQQCCGPYLGRDIAAEAGVNSSEDLYDQGRLYADRGGAAARNERLVFSGSDLADAQGAADRVDRQANLGTLDQLGDRGGTLMEGTHRTGAEGDRP
jgi:PRC-barrel domain